MAVPGVLVFWRPRRKVLLSHIFGGRGTISSETTSDGQSFVKVEVA